MPAPIRPLHLAVSIDRPGVRDAESYVRAARLAERGRLDFVTLGDTLGPPRRGESRLDALAVLARVAPATRRIGLVPTVTTTHTEPFHVADAVSTLDQVSNGRAGWTAEVSATEAEARHFGRRAPAPADALWREAAAVADVAARLWDSWEDDAEIRDAATGRFIDRDKLHRVDFEGPGWSVRGPSAAPRPPQGRPVTAVDATRLPPREAAARHADVIYLRTGPTPAPGAVRAARDDLHARMRALGRDPGRVVFLASLPVALYAAADAVALADLAGSWWADGVVDGFHFRPRDPDRDLALLVDGTVPVLQHRGLLRSFYPGGTLREHLCLPRPANRYATAATAGRTA
ncbi:LLM class flavin-dependent oxidoreductase [Streptomyces sp. NRRL B-1677]|uniref:LLM class flavin-dependent oxidoreductase n=1 Tax=Streptomyces klenkii TaxID=1420899 RepID=A0A3B0AZG8_9ACTN|nr:MULTISPECIES: LLM class flavin-dependent oxidoreductase [Streptomyces]MBF6048543.1 LLM class flavin-dependent oxidoreductase [Streptomyces sp. NRRL B-1677]RKN65648.1 LLM class flavin-dependent oxidoreductase [Streptomyces klenkii]